MKQRSTEFRSGPRFTNNKGARSIHVHDLIVAQFSCEDAWTKRSVSANIEAPEEDNKSHILDYEEES